MKIGLLDHMGYGNLGDAATQEALIANIKKRLTDATIVGFSLNPDDTRERHNIPCYSITHWHPGLNRSRKTTADGANLGSRAKSLLKKLPMFSSMASYALNLIRELLHLLRSFRVLKSLDTLIIAGGGQLSELWRGPWSHPYNVFKFSMLTKLANRQLFFINVGAGPLDSFLGRFFVKCSIHLADYVSFRDVPSQTLVYQLNVKRQTHVYPDSAYALDLAEYEDRELTKRSRPLVGINPIGFCDPRIWPKTDRDAYARYLDSLAAFSLWLLGCNYTLKIFSAEVSVDVYALQDLKARLLSSISRTAINEICVPPSENVQDLLAEMSRLDFVITSKFHGVVFSHLLAKPVLALSYHPKIDDLMLAVGHGQFCLNIESFDYECLKKAFISLVDNAQDLRSQFRQTTRAYSNKLKEQFDEIFVARNMQPDSREVAADRNEAVFRGSV